VTEKTIILPENGNGNGHGAAYQLSVLVPKRRYLSYLRERWWVVLLCLVLAVGTVLVYETIRPESYKSFAQLYLSGEVQLDTINNLLNEESLNYFGTQIELLKSARLQSEVFEKLGIQLKPDERRPVDIEVIQPLKTSILLVQATGSDPSLTQRFLQILVEQYLAYKKETRLLTSEDLVISLTDQVGKKAKDLQATQDRWAEFARTNNVAVLEEEAKSSGLYLADLNLQLAKLKLEKRLLEEGLSPMPKTTTAGAESSVTATNSISTLALDSNLALTASDTALKTAKVELEVRRAERDKAVADHGEIAGRRLNDEIARLENMVAVLREQNVEQKRFELKETEKRIAAMEASIPAWEAKVLGVNERLSQGQRLKSDIQREQSFYEKLLGALQTANLSKNVQQERLSVLQAATPSQLTKRYLPVRITVAVFFGLAVSLGIVLGWYLLDDRFVSVRDIQDQFGEKVLGLVPQIRVAKSKPKQALIEAGDARHAYAESYRHLRSALLLSSLGESRPQTLLFTGALPGEGKTTVSVNLARVLARSGLRVVLVDADAHGAGVHRLLEKESEPGLLDFLRGDAAVTEIVHSTEIPELTFIPAGTRTNESEGLFLRPKLEELLEELRGKQDFVILDAAPILATDDSALLVPHADAVVLVVRPFRTRARLVRQALDMLYQRQAKQVTIILNRARKDDLAGHYARNGIVGHNHRGREEAKV
jgi:capsular exopolysaccharide synthesis family protein